jgi:prevent-host-death family protein
MPNLRVAEGIVPLSQFKANAAELLKRISETGAPIVITQNGRAAGVLLSPAEFDLLTERARFVQAISEGVADVESGRLIDQQSMVAEIASRYDDTGR